MDNVNKNRTEIVFEAKVILIFSLLSILVVFSGFVFGHNTVDKYFSISIDNLSNPLMYITFITHVLGSASLEHCFTNLTFIYLIGPLVEKKYGSKSMIVMILIVALVTGISQLFTDAVSTRGSSGVTFMLVTLAAFEYFKNKKIDISGLLVIVMAIAKELAGIFAIKGNNTSRSTHILGAVLGVIFGIYFKIRGTNYLDEDDGYFYEENY